MMEGIREYILSVISTVFVCGLLQMCSPEGTIGAVVRFLSGLVITVCVISPLIQDRMINWDLSYEALMQDSQWAVSEGQELADEAYCEHIQEASTAYILDKAEALGVQINVKIELEETFPYEIESVHLEGTAAPYARQSILGYITTDFGISEEKILWNS